MVRSGNECCMLGLKSSAQASLFGLACAALGAVVASLCWANLELEVAASPRLVEPVRKVSASNESSDASQQPEHPVGYNCDECAFCQARPEKMAEQHSAPFVPIHQREAYTVQSPDILTIDVTGITESPESGQQPIHGEHLVHADGNVDLGSWGKLDVAGKTTAEIESAVKKLIDAEAANGSVYVSVHTKNSRVYYVITQSAGLGDYLQRVPYTGNETVVDAIAAVGPLNEMSRHRIWIARPKPGSERLTSHQSATQPAVDMVIPIQWQQPSSTVMVVANHALQPGDRIFITRSPSWGTFIENCRTATKILQARGDLSPKPVEMK